MSNGCFAPLPGRNRLRSLASAANVGKRDRGRSNLMLSRMSLKGRYCFSLT